MLGSDRCCLGLIDTGLLSVQVGDERSNFNIFRRTLLWAIRVGEEGVNSSLTIHSNGVEIDRDDTTTPAVVKVGHELKKECPHRCILDWIVWSLTDHPHSSERKKETNSVTPKSFSKVRGGGLRQDGAPYVVPVIIVASDIDVVIVVARDVGGTRRLLVPSRRGTVASTVGDRHDLAGPSGVGSVPRAEAPF